MKTPAKPRDKGVPPLELIEEATGLLKVSPGALLIYYLGTVPFVIAFLYYWAEMSGSTSARSNSSLGALGLTALFLIMKTVQSRFTCAVRESLAAGLDEPWTRRRWLNCFAIQTIFQPWGLILIPAAALLLLPFAHVFSFFQNLLVTGAGLRPWKQAARDAIRMAGYWPASNHGTLAILSLFSLVIYLNGWLLLLNVPFLLKTLLGIESVFTMGGFDFGNGTLLMGTLCLCYLFLDPLLKTIYVLRCFHAESRQTGIDLSVDLKRLFRRAAVVILLLFSTLSFPTRTRAQEGSPSPVAAVPPPELDDSIEEVLNRREYRWRLPPKDAEETGTQQKGFISQMLDDLFNKVRQAWRDLCKWWDDLMDKLKRYFKRDREPDDETHKGFGNFSGWYGSAQVLGYVVLTLVLIGVAIFVIRQMQLRGKSRVTAGLYAGPLKAPDLEDEQLLASDLPEDEWLKLGAEMLQRGERRLAVRAYFLAIIARLSRLSYLTIARHKTNRDYDRELRRRARGRDDLQQAFARAISVFEEIWYGEHSVNDSNWAEFESARAILFQPVEEPAGVQK